MHALTCVLITVFSAISFAQGTVNGTDVRKTLNACPAGEPVKLDGFLTEGIWSGAAPVSDFIQRELTEGAPPSEKTEVRILYDEENLFIGVKCFDSEPDKILRREMNRDSELQDDDNFAVVIDTFQDRRNGYYFRTNPNGARNDALVSGGETSESWNGVWDEEDHYRTLHNTGIFKVAYLLKY